MSIDEQGTAGFAEAAKAIEAGHAEARALWVLLAKEDERDGYDLKPMPWEGPGQYQRIVYANGRDGFVRLPVCKALPMRAALTAIAPRP